MEVGEPHEVCCCASMFAMDNAKDEAHCEGGRRQIMNLKRVNEFVSTTYFCFVTLWGILPFLKRGQYTCKVDVKIAYFQKGRHARDKPYPGLFVGGSFTVGVFCHLG